MQGIASSVQAESWLAVEAVPYDLKELRSFPYFKGNINERTVKPGKKGKFSCLPGFLIYSFSFAFVALLLVVAAGGTLFLAQRGTDSPVNPTAKIGFGSPAEALAESGPAECNLEPAGANGCGSPSPIPNQESNVPAGDTPAPTPASPKLLPGTTASSRSKPRPELGFPSCASQPGTCNSPSTNPTPTVADPPPVGAPVIGGADKIAFVNAGDIWAANLDGSELVRLTLDGGEKSNLQWAPDGRSVDYLAGKCVHSVDLATGRSDPVVCFDAAIFFDAFEISPDGQRVAVSLDHALYVVPFQREKLSLARTAHDLQAIGDCPELAPYTQNGRTVAVKSARWSQNGKLLAISRQAEDAGRLVDLIHILDISRCAIPFPRLDEFPAKRFTMSGYEMKPTIQNFAWDGDQLFALFSWKRNEGFGDLWVYSAELHRADPINPIGGVCCYRDPQWSPDGRYLLFVFQDMRLAPMNVTRLYYAPLATFGTGLAYAPLPLPVDFFADPHARPQPALRPAGP
jgi:dipeptidyl aminopeptidase/acylaminoacyl peptidase